MTKYDVIIIGGSYAGLSAAMSLGRARMKTLVIDSGKPCNATTPHSHNFLTQDGSTPDTIFTLGKEQVLQYPTVNFIEATAVSLGGEDNGFEVGLLSGEKMKARKVVFATGIKDQFPEIDGFADCWGISVIHCPFCHGYEYAHEKTGLLINSDEALHFGRFIQNWTKQLSIFTNGKPVIKPDDQQLLAKMGIPIIEKNIVKIEHRQGHISNLVFSDSSTSTLKALYARLPFTQHCPLPAKAGCRFNEQGYLVVDDFQQTTVEGIYAAGDNTSPMRSVAGAVAAGSKAGAMIVHALVPQ